MTVQKLQEKSCFVRFIAIALIILFVPASTLAVLMFNINNVLLNRDTYKTALARQDTYQRIPALTAEQLTYVPSADDCSEDACQLQQSGSQLNSMPVPAAYMANINPGTWEAIFSILMPTDWLQAQGESLVDQVFDGLNSSSQAVSATISFESVRSRLTDSDYQAISQTVLATAPTCNENDLLAYAAVLMGGSTANLPFCIPTEEFRPMLESAISSTIGALVQSLPAEITFNPKIFFKQTQETINSTNSTPNVPFNTLRWIQIGFMVFPVIPIILLGLIGTTAVRSWDDAGRWLGIPLAISGLAAMFITMIIMLSSRWMVSSYLLPQLSFQASPGIVQMIQDVVKSVAVKYAVWNGLIAGIMFLGGSLSCAVFGWNRSRQASPRS